MLGAGITLIVISGPVLDLALSGSAVGLPVFPYASVAAGALFAWAALRYLAFSAIEPAAEGRPTAAPPPPGVFLEKDPEPGHARAIFTSAVCNGIGGVAVSRTNPAVLRRQTGLARLPVIWLAQSSYEKCLPPANLEVLAHALLDLGDRGRPCIVLIEDLDYLLTNGGETKTLDFLSEMQRFSSRTGMTLLLSSDLLTDDEKIQFRDLGINALSRKVDA